MVAEFVLWILLTILGSNVLQSSFSMAQAVSLLIAAPLCALIVSLGTFLLNRHFRHHAVKATAHVDRVLPPQRSGGLAQVEVSVPSGGKRITATLTPEETPQKDTELTVWVCGRRVLPSLPTPGSDFRMLALCLVIVLLVLLGYLCTLLLPDPTK